MASQADVLRVMLTLTIGTAAIYIHASGCPCVSVSHRLPQTAAGCLKKSCESPTQFTDDSCVNATYGSSTCAAWDSVMPECQSAVPPSYCSQLWCYVDAEQCRMSTTLYERTSYFSNIDGLYFSYATCGGDAAAFKAFKLIRDASSQHTSLTVVLPSATYHPYHYKEGAAASNNTELTHYRAEDVPWKGILVEYFEALSAHTFSGLDEPTFHLTWTSVASREHDSRLLGSGLQLQGTC